LHAGRPEATVAALAPTDDVVGRVAACHARRDLP